MFVIRERVYAHSVHKISIYWAINGSCESNGLKKKIITPACKNALCITAFLGG